MMQRNRVPKSSQLTYLCHYKHMVQKKHQANGCFAHQGGMAEKVDWMEEKSCGSAHSNKCMPGVKRPSLLAEGPRKKKVRVHAVPCINT